MMKLMKKRRLEVEDASFVGAGGRGGGVRGGGGGGGGMFKGP